MFSSNVQPSLVSLFSSTGSEPLALFESSSDPDLVTDSFVCLLEDHTSSPTPGPSKTLISPLQVREDDDSVNMAGCCLHQTVLHVQSPTLRRTYIRCPPSTPRRRGAAGSLGLKHPWMHLQVRNMGREWSFEVGLVDRSNREGVVRCSTFQVLSFSH